MSTQRFGSIRTRFTFFLATVLIASASLEASAGTWLPTPPAGAPARGGNVKTPVAEARVTAYDDTSLNLTVTFPGLEVSTVETEAGTFVKVQCPKAELSNGDGLPGLPVVRRMFCAPEGSTIDVVVEEGEAQVIDLAAAGMPHPVLPRQPMVLAAPLDGTDPSVSGDAANKATAASSTLASQTAPFQFDRSAYALDATLPSERAVVSEVGIMGRLHLYNLEVRPVSYNAARGVLTVRPELRIRLRFQGGTGGFEGVLPATVARAAVLNPPRLPSGGGRDVQNYLIITAQALSGSAPLTQFANAKTAQGYFVTTYAVPVGADRTAIKNYIKSQYNSNNRPNYMLLVGDANMYETTAAADTIPTWVGSGSVVYTDLYYACMDTGDDWLAEFPFGRWPVRTVSDLQSIVDKTLYVETALYPDPSYTKRAVFLAGSDPLAGAEAISDEIIATYMQPHGLQATKVYAGFGAGTPEVADALNAGSFLAVYFGHSAYQQWSEPMFTNNDIDALTNSGMYPFVVSFSCNTSAFPQVVDEPVFNEKLMRVGGKGASATWGCLLVNYDWPTTQDLYRYLMASIYTSGIREVGPAELAAKNMFIAAYGAETRSSRYYAEVMELFGDPSMKLPLPPLKNYIVITAPSYLGSVPLNQLIAAREARGFDVTIYCPPSGTTNTAIKNYVHSLWGTDKTPDYVVIIGDTSGFTSTTNTIPHFVGLGPRQGTTDWPYVCMDPGDDWYPELPIGRLSVQSVAQLQAVVDKTLKVESGNFSDPEYVKRGTFLANGSSDVAGLAEATHNWVIDTYLTPNGYTGTKIYGSLGGDTADVAHAVNDGTLWTVYMGHSADTGWWDPQFYQSDVNALFNNGLYGLAMGWSCHSAQYELGECFGETWLRAANKGAAAYISASQFIYWGSAEQWKPSLACEKAFFTSIFVDDKWEIGPAWLNGMYRFLKDYGAWDGDPSHLPPQNPDKCRDFMEEFVILGDPALELPRPYGFTLAANPPSTEVCSPPSDQAIFTILIGQTGGFEEIVTLSATGTPLGAVVQFSENQQAPPFSSVMTVSNLGGAAAGPYSIAITGTSASRTRSTSVSLGVSHALPAVPALSSPADGAVSQARQPVLVWQAAEGALAYDIQIAADIGFTQVVYTKTVADTSHTVETMLTAGTHYFWRLRASNGCGQSEYSAPFGFTTIAQADYFTQQFLSGFDLDNFSIRFIPDGSGSYYRMCGDPATSLPSDPTGGTTLTIIEDGSVLVSPGRTVKLYGQNYTSFYVNENGNLTFGSGDSTWQETLTDHFSKPRIAALFNDLYASGGARSWKAFSDHVAVTFLNVHEYNSTNLNTFQTEIFDNGEIRITWLQIDSSNAVVGLSQGNGVPSDFVQDDLSAAMTCIVRGACCNGETCTIVSQSQCVLSGGTYHGDSTTCSPNPCLDYNEACLIISEVVDATLSGGCPKFIEITNTAATDFVFIEGGVIVQHGNETDVYLDVNLAGVTIPAGQSVVVNSNQGGTCTGAFQGAYGFPADINTPVAFGDGDDRYMLTDKADGSHIMDIYGEFGVDGTGRDWEYTESYAYRRPGYTAGRATYFAPQEWYFAGPGALAGPSAEELVYRFTTPDSHMFTETCTGPDHRGDMNCDWYLNGSDIQMFVNAVVSPDHYTGCDILRGDVNRDGLVDVNDCQPFVNRMLGL
jgi:hypothetical protein